ncbi:tyrosine-protein phosphatase 10D-like [Mercenaria mercenaria]|uniref:tyrosine-protein phosphatase 10D-like n=1 Tax=Mercenaria mercenaria TaxID=6596 RepID=UPI00234EE277|nr:tyrosine-protein phosphatase 10D-like [Mercenaria mercenaria]
MSEAPRNLQITGVTSRGFNISWDKPGEIYSEENYGYVLQIKDDQDKCVKEIIYRCSNCSGQFLISELNGLCSSGIQPEIGKTKQELEGQLTYPASLNPDIAYTVTVTAINDAGRGYPASDTERTKEEAPQKPDNVMMEDVMAKSVKVTWNIADPRPGKTTYKITLDAQEQADDKVIVVEGFENRSCTFSNLEEFWSYQVTVNASTAIGSNISDVKEIKTLPAAPGNVLSFRPINAPSDNYRKLKIVWKAPELLERNSIITNYSFRHNTTGVFQTEMLNQETDFTHEYSVMVDVVPEEYYSFEVFAINEQNENGSVSYLNKQAVAGVPKNIENTTQIKVIPKEKVKDVQQTQFTVTFVQEFFEQSENGQIRATGLVACVESKCSTSNIEDLSDFNNMDTWKEASKGTYRVTDESWLEVIKAKSAGPNARRKRDVTNLEYTVGSENCASVNTDEYCNGPLHPDTRYMLFAVACTNGGCLISQPYGPFITLAVPDEDNNLMIIGIVVAVGVVVLIGAVVGFILLRRRKSGPGKMKPVSESDDEDFTTIDPAVAKIQRKRPILLNEIEEYVNKMHKDSNLLFSAEYEDLKTLSPKHACEAADREENRMRNRYINIIPFDHTRVKLSTNGEDDSSDYINANYLPGYSSPREYIGCQGPIPGTIDDFWRMTWEQNVSVVVMLTLCKEGQKIKCEQYWPDEVGEPKQYGDVIVEITSYSNIRTYDYRMFKITNGSTTRVVKHFHFLSWLDFQANVHHDIILDFIEHVRQHVQPPDTSGPMIIHCSAGVGRTGTYIALDHLMQFINEHDFDVNIDIFDLVLKLRENRQHMVQTEQQYVFIHDCVKEIMDRKRRQMENIYENQAFLEKLNAAQDENIYQNEQSLYENVSQAKSEQNTEL